MSDETDRPPDASQGTHGPALPDRYRLIRELGRGGMAVVYLAEDLKHQRRVAIKVLPELAAVLGAERFLAEIRTTASLQHPHILALYDSGRTGGADRRPDSLFYVMPFVEGESLRDRLTREKQLPLPIAVRLTGEIASALDYAHRHGVVHRDVKPENILLHDGAAMIADFGIALAVSQAAGERLTETGVSLGTPQYMSPEQAAGASSLGSESDTYSLACVCYEMLAGEPPFTGPTAQAIHAKRFREPPPRVGTVRDVPGGVDELLARTMARNPADRPTSAAAFATALAAAAVSGTTTVPAPGTRPRSSRWPAAVLAPLVAILGYGVWHFT